MKIKSFLKFLLRITILAVLVGLFVSILQLKKSVEKRDGVVKPTTKMIAKPAEAKTDSVDAAKLPEPATLQPK